MLGSGEGSSGYRTLLLDFTPSDVSLWLPLFKLEMVLIFKK